MILQRYSAFVFHVISEVKLSAWKKGRENLSVGFHCLGVHCRICSHKVWVKAGTQIGLVMILGSNIRLFLDIIRLSVICLY